MLGFDIARKKCLDTIEMKRYPGPDSRFLGGVIDTVAVGNLGIHEIKVNNAESVCASALTTL